MRGLSFWTDLVAFIRDWPRWRRERHAHAPTIPHLMHAYAVARRRHHGAAEAYARLRAARIEALKLELGR